jgi:hypothetical protein
MSGHCGEWLMTSGHRHCRHRDHPELLDAAVSGFQRERDALMRRGIPDVDVHGNPR